MKKFVLKLDLQNDKEKQRKALKTLSALSGIDEISVDVKGKKLTVIGTVDPVTVVSKLRKKHWQADIISVGLAKEPEKKEEPKKEEAKEEPKKEEAKKEEPKKEEAKKEEPQKEDAKKEEPKKGRSKERRAQGRKEGPRTRTGAWHSTAIQAILSSNEYILLCASQHGRESQRLCYLLKPSWLSNCPGLSFVLPYSWLSIKNLCKPRGKFSF